MIPSLRRIGNILCNARGDKLALSIDTKQIEPGKHTQLLCARQHLVLEILPRGFSVLRILVGIGVELLPLGHAQWHVGSSVRDHHTHDLTDIPRLLGVQAHQRRPLQCIRQGTPSPARHNLQLLLRPRNRSRGRQQHISAVALERNQTDLVAALVRFREETHRRALGGIHTIEGHGTTGIDDEDDERSRLPGHFLRSHVGLFDEDTASLVLGADGAQTTISLVGRGGTKGGIDGESYDLTLGQHGLDVPSAILGEDESASAALAGFLSLGEGDEVRVHGGGVDVEHEFLGYIWYVGRVILFVFFIGFVLLFFILLFLLFRFRIVVLLIHWWRRWWWWGWRHHLILIHGSVDKRSTGSNGKLDSQPQIITINLPPLQRRSGTRHLTSKNLGTMSLTSRTNRLLAQILNLTRRNRDILQKLASKHNGGLKIALVLDRICQGLLGLGRALLSTRAEADDGVNGFDAGGDFHLFGIGGEGDGDTVEEMVAELALIGVEGGDEEGSAGVGHGDALAFHDDLAFGDDIE
mmetsp:Transcript_27674/g.49849  ORF Transcript_27674/g.49849 Transcript_27674/m.49849 type:complete len:523 (+) Transcript_27674:240-1808(+)